MTTPTFLPPQALIEPVWQWCLNAVEVPPRSEQRDAFHSARVRARWIWERDGETWLDGRVMAAW